MRHVRCAKEAVAAVDPVAEVAGAAVGLEAVVADEVAEAAAVVAMAEAAVAGAVAAITRALSPT